MDESRLLTDEEIKAAVYKNSRSKVNWAKVVTPRDYIIREAQDTRSYKIGFDEGYAKAKEEFCQP